MRRYLLTASLTLLLALWAQPALADSVPIGQISFDTVISPLTELPAFNAFDLTNLTGGLTSPDPGVMDAISLSVQLVVTVQTPDGTTSLESVARSGIASNSLIPVDLLDLPTNDQVLSAVLTGTLDTTLVTLNGGGSPVTLSSSFTVTDPFNGGMTLTACTGSNACSQGLLSASSAVPEPGTLLLLGSGLGSVLLWRRRRLGG